MDNLLTKCNADVFKILLDLKEESPINGEKLIAILQKHEHPWQMKLEELTWFGAYLPYEIWNTKIHTFHLLFQSQKTTKMP